MDFFPANPSVAYLVWIAVLLCVMVYFLSRTYPGEVYIIWYANSFSFLLFLGAEIVAQKRDVSLTKLCRPYEELCNSAFDTLTNVPDEIRLVLIVPALIIAPQALTYILSGITGCASAPRLVTQTLKVASWSFIKFLAALSGILLARPFASLVVGNSAPINLFTPGLVCITLAFCFGASLALCEQLVESLTSIFHADDDLEQIRRLILRPHKWATRRRLNKQPNLFTG